MNIRFILIMSIVALCSVACKKTPTDTPPEVVTENKGLKIAGNYSGYVVAKCKYFQDKHSANETVVISANDDGSANITLSSKLWGKITISNAKVEEKQGVYSLTGNGTALMGMGEKKSTYKCNCSAVVHNKDKIQVDFTVPEVMGGLTISFRSGEIKVDRFMADTYIGYSDANCSFFQHFYTNDEKLVATAKGDGTLSVVFDSSTWGKFEVAKAVPEKKGNDEYTFYGTGTIVMSMMGAMAGEYDFEMFAATNANKDKYLITIRVPAVMGGLTITLQPGTAPKQE